MKIKISKKNSKTTYSGCPIAINKSGYAEPILDDRALPFGYAEHSAKKGELLRVRLNP